MRVRVANAGRANADQDVARANGRNIDLLLFERRTDGGEADSFHDRGRLALLTCHVERSETSLIISVRPAKKWSEILRFAQDDRIRRRSTAETAHRVTRASGNIFSPLVPKLCLGMPMASQL